MSQSQPTKPLVARHEELWNLIRAGSLTTDDAARALVAEGYPLAPQVAEDVMRLTPLTLKRSYLRGPGSPATPPGQSLGF